MASDAQIREHVRQLEDAIEAHASAQFLGDEDRAIFSLNLHHLTEQIHAFAEAAVNMEGEYITELLKPSDQQEEDAAAAEVYADADVVVSEMVGLSDHFLELRKLLTDGVQTDQQFIYTVAIIGMPGIGKTTLAKKLFHDSLVEPMFECRAFVTVGRKWQFEEILRAIIAQVVNLDYNEQMINEDLVNSLQRNLRGRKFLIILDGISNLYLFLQVRAIIPVEHNGSLMMLTTIGSSEDFNSIYFYKIRFLNEEESWELLRKKVFGEDEAYCPRQLIKPGKKISEKCEGLPLLILRVAELLREAENSREYWEEVVKKRNPLFEEALDQVYRVLLPSYQSLPQYLQMNFLYMGAFPAHHIISLSEFENLWRAEGFYDPPFFNALDLLNFCSLVVVRQVCSMSARVKACTLHISYRHLTKREAEKNKVFLILDIYEDCLVERLKDHRSLVIHENILFAIKEMHETMASLSRVRSVLCMGPYQPYQVPICSDWGLLRVLYALTIRFYEFPSNLGKLILLRYLSLTCNANLHLSISKLWNLQFLIVHPHLSIRRNLSDSYVPVEIWDLKELLHLQIIGRNLPDPPPNTVLPNLVELLDVGIQSCTRKVLESVPSLEKLRVQIELGPVAPQNMSCFDHLSCLHQLKSFQSVIINPHLLPEQIIQPPPRLSISSYSVVKLTLKGFGFPWVEMSKLANLPNLVKLTLQSYAFRGEKWDAKEIMFSKLWYLCIEDTDLVHWNADNGTFKRLGSLTLKSCYKLREIPLLINCIEVALVDCNPLAEASAKQWNCRSVIANYSWK